MRLILAGQRSFGAAVLEAVLAAGHDVAAVCAPDPDDKLAIATGRVRGIVSLAALTEEGVRAIKPDLIVAAHSHEFIGRRSRAACPLGAIGYHPSLLPRHRGRDAVRWTVAMGDPVAGGTVYWFTERVDGGPIAAQDWCFVGRHETASDLWRDKLFPLGVRLILETLKDLDNGRIVAIPQQEEFASWEPSYDRPPLYKPELPELGTGPSGYEVIAHRSQL